MMRNRYSELGLLICYYLFTVHQFNQVSGPVSSNWCVYGVRHFKWSVVTWLSLTRCFHIRAVQRAEPRSFSPSLYRLYICGRVAEAEAVLLCAEEILQNEQKAQKTKSAQALSPGGCKMLKINIIEHAFPIGLGCTEISKQK